MTYSTPNRVKVGIPWRTSEEELEQNRPKIQSYEDAVREAGGEPVLLPLSDPTRLEEEMGRVDGFVLPGSPADVEPEQYGSRNTGLSEPADKGRERTDWAILEHALMERKPVLAICYGCQSLNVYLGGTLVQDVRWETGTGVAHRRKDVTPEAREDPEHEVKFSEGSRLASLNGSTQAVVNSSHHQSVLRAGRGLKVTGRSSDGVAESVEWAGDGNWVVGVQWHPERMKGDPLAQSLFSDLVAAVESHIKTTAK